MADRIAPVEQQALRQQVIEIAREMNRSGLNNGTSGNVSTRFGDGMLITPSGVPYETLQPTGLVYVDAQGVHSGPERPSSEWRFHHDIYTAYPQARAVVHTHSRHATALACLERSIPAFHYMVAVAGGVDIRCAPYATFGTQALSNHVVEALADRSACLMAHHGLVARGASLDAALALASEVEHLAATYLQCLAVGEPEVLSNDEMQRVLEKFRNYGNVRPRP